MLSQLDRFCRHHIVDTKKDRKSAKSEYWKNCGVGPLLHSRIQLLDNEKSTQHLFSQNSKQQIEKLKQQIAQIPYLI